MNAQITAWNMAGIQRPLAEVYLGTPDGFVLRYLAVRERPRMAAVIQPETAGGQLVLAHGNEPGLSIEVALVACPTPAAAARELVTAAEHLARIEARGGAALAWIGPANEPPPFARPGEADA